MRTLWSVVFGAGAPNADNRMVALCEVGLRGVNDVHEWPLGRLISGDI
jgi:hypothetical protein